MWIIFEVRVLVGPLVRHRRRDLERIRLLDGAIFRGLPPGVDDDEVVASVGEGEQDRPSGAWPTPGDARRSGRRSAPSRARARG